MTVTHINHQFNKDILPYNELRDCVSYEQAIEIEATDILTNYFDISVLSTIIITVSEPLYFFKTPNDQHLVLEGDSIIACEARGESLPRISWQKEIGDEFVEVSTKRKLNFK